MDRATLAAYDAEASALATLWASRAPTHMYGLLTRFFQSGPTIDVGCGAGGDVAWLSAQGFPTVGVDGSSELLAHARQAAPTATFIHDYLPHLGGVASSAFTNVLCQTVLPHLPKSHVGPAVARLRTLLVPGGTLYLSWRVVAEEARDESGRLYTAIDPGTVFSALGDAEILHDESVIGNFSGTEVRILVARLSLSRSSA